VTKGATLTSLEAQQRAYADASVAQYRALMDTQGTDKYGSVPLTRRETDDRWLGLWFILGQADDLVSTAFWQSLALKQPVHEVGALDLRSRTAWEDPARRASALAIVGPEMQATYAWLRAMGLHSGQPRPRADDAKGNDPVPSGRGSAAGHFQGAGA
jgi:hypothetical protein